MGEGVGGVEPLSSTADGEFSVGAVGECTIASDDGCDVKLVGLELIVIGTSFEMIGGGMVVQVEVLVLAGSEAFDALVGVALKDGEVVINLRGSLAGMSSFKGGSADERGGCLTDDECGGTFRSVGVLVRKGRRGGDGDREKGAEVTGRGETEDDVCDVWGNEKVGLL